jgi:hypothetical protein
VAFVKDDPGKAASLVAHVQKLTEDNKSKNLRSFVVFMGGPELKDSLAQVATDKKITIPMTFLPEGASQASLGRFKINPEAKNTILVYNRQTVHASFVNVDDKSFEDVAKATEEMLAK